MKCLSVLSSLVFSKKNNHKKQSPYPIKNNYACEDSGLEWNIKAYLNREISAKDCIQNLIEYMAYNDCLHIIENEEIFGIIEDFLDSATWKTEWTVDCGDYNPSCPESWLGCIYNIYDSKLTAIGCAETVLTDLHIEITTEAVMNFIYDSSVTAEMYEHKEELKAKSDTLKATICGGNFTPKEALLMIKENWKVLYPYKAAYEAIEYCVVASENHTIHKYFDSAFRDYGYKIGALYKQAKSK